ncbi:ATP phosphoribosyltransferase [Chelatococcus sp. SYSU_G07232]|uniref:ATP phosphoribosyltransferase n=1 Tax=Chelatococcus albus TaxID=3047466 RepID=A0ABT7AEU7_9HYPH|nr:ATP phosphoribosyltransferase [Chelatococcus sp. SYSU_G07232]MDJ1157894.1 ATP phosphoribosyltransferase [Chelatococcus sp. SYSU_G07232]
MSEAPLVLAVPSKGRLQENAAAFFARAGLTFVQSRGARDYRGTLKGLAGVEVLFLSASEIAAQLASGAAHLGITGEDLIREDIPDADAAVELLTPLGFGHANVVVAVPQAWIDVRTMADLDDVAADMRHRHGRKMRVATKYVNLTRRFFGSHGIADYRIVESLGATEGAPASGAAEIIVDITTTGATLAANALKIVEDGVILRSEANLIASVRAPWSATARAAARTILTRIAAEEAARTTREVRAYLAEPDEALITDLRENFGAELPFGLGGNGALVIHCPRGQVFALAERLAENGADHIAVHQLDYVFRASNPLSERLFTRIG